MMGGRDKDISAAHGMRGEVFGGVVHEVARGTRGEGSRRGVHERWSEVRGGAMHGVAAYGRDGAEHGTGGKCVAGPRTEEERIGLSVGAVRRRLQLRKLHLKGHEKRGRGVEGEGVGGRPKLGLTKESIEDVLCGDGPEPGPNRRRREVGAVFTIVKQTRTITGFRTLYR